MGAIAKYVDHLPLYRQENARALGRTYLAANPLHLDRASGTRALEPLHRCLHRELLASGYVQIDETPVRCHDPDENRGQTAQG